MQKINHHKINGRVTLRSMLAFGLLFCCFYLPSLAQEQVNRFTTHGTTFGIGSLNLYDTYLSPYEYSGLQGSFTNEKIRATHWANGRVTTQQITDGYVGMAENKMLTAKAISAQINFQAAWHYQWELKNRLKLFVGGGISTGLGGIYNTRNGNNPAQAKAKAELFASVMAIYPFQIRKQPFSLKYQVNLPWSGLAFSPNYNQSYYEIFSLGHYDHNICFTHPFNAPSLKQWITLDFPIKGFTFRIGYNCDLEQSALNNLRHHTYRHSFQIGYVKDFYFIKRKESPAHSIIYQ